MNLALGDNNGNMDSNGELFLQRNVLASTKNDNGVVVFDVGANVGHWTLSLLKIAEEIGISNNLFIHCFEPSTFSFSQLQASLLTWLGKNKEVHIINSGMGKIQDKMELHINADGAGTNSLYNRRTEGIDLLYEKSEIVQITTIDTYCMENNISHIDFLKIDVEGHELAVVQGAEGMLKQKAIDFIQFEYGGCWIDSRTLFRDMYDLLTGFGYVVGKIMPDGIEFHDRYDQRLETFQMANYCACLPESTGLFKKIKPWMA